jgi:hypothetical protein
LASTQAPDKGDPGEHALVVKAICDGLGNCFLWDERRALNAKNDPDLRGLTTSYIRSEVVAYVRSRGPSVVKQKRETRENWRDSYDYFYYVILPVKGFKHGVFVEMVLSSADDPDYPEVTLVGAHPQRK